MIGERNENKSFLFYCKLLICFEKKGIKFNGN
jgi:hypothetical protein